MTEEKKAGNYVAITLSLLLLAACLYALFAAGKDYHAALNLKPAPAATVPQPQKAPAAETFDTELKFRKFFITAPGAKQVALAADFNNWGAAPIILTPYNKGYFDTTVTLSAGEYKYVFLVDGKETLDPVNKEIIDFNGRKVNVKTVK